MATRGIRNNNPLNIRRGQRWQGLIEPQTDPAFCQFVAPVWGLRAGFIILRRYIQVYHLNTITGIISRWAPDSENNTLAYIKYVSNVTQIDPLAPISTGSKMKLCSIVAAMSAYECGHPCTLQEVTTAYNIVFNSTNP